MSTANDSRNSEMTSDAYALLDCFISGLDEMVYEIAEEIAQHKGRVSPDGIVQIQSDDVRAAAEAVFGAIREQAGKSIPAEVARQIEAMHQCVLEKCKIQNAGE